MEAYLRQCGLDLVKRLAAKIRRAQELGLGPLHEVADRHRMSMRLLSLGGVRPIVGQSVERAIGKALPFERELGDRLDEHLRVERRRPEHKVADRLLVLLERLEAAHDTDASVASRAVDRDHHAGTRLKPSLTCCSSARTAAGPCFSAASRRIGRPLSIDAMISSCVALRPRVHHSSAVGSPSLNSRPPPSLITEYLRVTQISETPGLRRIAKPAMSPPSGRFSSL